MYQKTPWTLKDNKKSKKTKATGKVFFKEDVAVSTARVQKLFENNKEKVFSNQEIAVELGMSVGTVSGITNRLEALQNIKIVKVRQTVSALSQVFQHKDGSLHSVEKEKAKEDTAKLVKELFENNTNQVFTKEDIIEQLSNSSKGQIEESIKILLLNGVLKLVGTKDSKAQYQYINGNLEGFTIYGEPDENYSSLGSFLESKQATHKKEYFTKELANKEYRLFYSSTIHIICILDITTIPS